MRVLQRISLLAIAISFLLIPTAPGQIVGGTIGGVVRDSSGATLGGATVVVRQIETGTSRTLTTSGNGLFNAPSIPVGHYTVTASQDGFDPQTQTSIELSQGQSIHLDFLLGLATVKQQVEVSAAGDLVNVTTQSTSGLIEERQVKELPLNGRSYDALITLNPGTVNYTAHVPAVSEPPNHP